MNKINFKGINDQLLSECPFILQSWLPGGSLIGKEYCCADIHGGAGRSLKVNIDTGKWADFATGDKGGDLISLYAAINNLSQSEAAKELRIYEPINLKAPVAKPPAVTKPQAVALIPPPGDAPEPRFNQGSIIHTYRDINGQVMFHVERTPEKQFYPHSWDGTKWIRRAWPINRPLFNLELLKDKKYVLITEGEKACLAAQTLAGKNYAAITWQGGAQAVTKTDWSPLYGRNILIWPDNDEPGIKAAQKIASILFEHCPQVKIITPSLGGTDDLAVGFDAADALEDGWDWNYFKTWAQARSEVYTQVTKHETDYDDEVDDNTAEPNVAEHIDIDELVEQMEDRGGYISQSVLAKIARFKLSTGQSGIVPQCNIDNVFKILERDHRYANRIWYDSFYNNIFTDLKFNDQEKPREWTSTDTTNLVIILQRYYGMFKITHPAVEAAIEVYAKTNTQNEVQGWLTHLQWDGTSRIGNFLHTYMGADDNEYTRAISKNWFISIAARIMSPGCKADNMVILEGPQGVGKSTALSILGGKWFSELTTEIGTPEFIRQIQGKILIEISELSSFNKAEVNKIKQTLTNQIDNVRPLFKNNYEPKPRQCIFVGTTNDDEYLKDPTGARRFWPILTSTINIDAITKDRDQLFAEAFTLYKQGHTWWEVPDSAKDEQLRRQASDGWEDYIEDYLLGRQETKIKDICKHALDLDAHHVTPYVMQRIASILKRKGWVCRIHKSNKKTVRTWVTTESGVTVTFNDENQNLIENSTHPKKEIPNRVPIFP